MAGLDITTAGFALKELYEGQILQNLLYPDNAMYAWLPKKGFDFEGSQYPIPVIYGNPQLISADPAQAFSGTPTSTKGKKFVITRIFKYGAARVSREVFKAAKGDLGAFVDGARMEVDGGYNAWIRRFAVELYRDGTGCIGIVPAGAVVNDAGGLLSIGPYSGGTQGNDIDNFEVGQQLVAAATVGGSIRTGSMFVVAVDRIGNTINVAATDGGAGSSPAGLITGLAASDFLFVKGDAANGSGSNVCVSGLDAWLPFTIAGGDSFFGVNRSADKQRLGGVHVDGTTGTLAGAPLEELLITGAAQCGKFGGKPRTAFSNWELWTAAEKSLGSKVTYDVVSSSDRADITFKSIRIHGGRAPIDLVPDQNAPASRIYMLDQDAVALYPLGELPEIVDDDGVVMLRSSGADAFDIRLAGYAQAGMNGPGKHCVIKTA